MIDCKHRRGVRCAIGEAGGTPTDRYCLRVCEKRERTVTVSVTMSPRSHPIAAGWRMMPGGSWYLRRGCGSCEGARRLVAELMEAEIETDDGYRPRRHGAD